MNSTLKKQSFIARFKNSIDPIPMSWAVPSCDWSSAITSCNANSETVAFDGCSELLDHEISIRGSETLYWTGSGCCTSNPLSASSQTPCSFNRRTVNKEGVRDPLVRSVGNNSITLDTENSSGYSSPEQGGFTVTCQGSGLNNTCDGQRQIGIQGAHYTGQSGRGLWDHTVSTVFPVVVQGHGGERKVLSGTLHVQHNLAHYVSLTTVTSPLTYDSNCCLPTGGGITTSFVGGPFDGKTESVSYGPGCGHAVLTDSGLSQSSLTLQHCL